MRRRIAIAVIALAACGCATAGEPVFLVFTAQGCPPCLRLKSDFGDEPGFQFIDIASSPGVTAHYGIRQTPTIIALGDSGEEIARSTGYNGQRHLRRWIEATKRAK